MIHYSLVCDAAHEFDGWFRDSATFDAQASSGVVVSTQTVLVYCAKRIGKHLRRDQTSEKSYHFLALHGVFEHWPIVIPGFAVPRIVEGVGVREKEFLVPQEGCQVVSAKWLVVVILLEAQLFRRGINEWHLMRE